MAIMISQDKNNELKNVLSHQDLNYGLRDLKASVLATNELC